MPTMSLKFKEIKLKLLQNYIICFFVGGGEGPKNYAVG